MSNRNWDENPNRPLADLLWKTLAAARGNMQVRQRLRGIVSDPARLQPIVQELGPNHAVVRELLEIGRHGQPDPKLVA